MLFYTYYSEFNGVMKNNAGFLRLKSQLILIFSVFNRVWFSAIKVDLASDEFFHLLITFANSLNPSLDLSHDTLIVFLNDFLKKLILKKVIRKTIKTQV